MRPFDDHSLEFWVDVFQACRLAGEGVSFEDFIIDSQRTLQDFGMDDAVEILESGFLPYTRWLLHLDGAFNKVNCSVKSLVALSRYLAAFKDEISVFPTVPQLNPVAAQNFSVCFMQSFFAFLVKKS